MGMGYIGHTKAGSGHGHGTRRQDLAIGMDCRAHEGRSWAWALTVGHMKAGSGHGHGT